MTNSESYNKPFQCVWHRFNNDLQYGERSVGNAYSVKMVDLQGMSVLSSLSISLHNLANVSEPAVIVAKCSMRL
jgi:hypothetical protein